MGYGGRPSKYKKKYTKMLIEHFSKPIYDRILVKEIIKSNGTIEREYKTVASAFPSFTSFAEIIGVDDDTLQRWSEARHPDDHKTVELRNTLKYPEFSGAYKRAKELQKRYLLDNALHGHFPPASFIFIAKNVADMKDKVETDLTSGGEKIEPLITYRPERKNNE